MGAVLASSLAVDPLRISSCVTAVVSSSSSSTSLSHLSTYALWQCRGLVAQPAAIHTTLFSLVQLWITVACLLVTLHVALKHLVSAGHIRSETCEGVRAPARCVVKRERVCEMRHVRTAPSTAPSLSEPVHCYTLHSVLSLIVNQGDASGRTWAPGICQLPNGMSAHHQLR